MKRALLLMVLPFAALAQPKDLEGAVVLKVLRSDADVPRGTTLPENFSFKDNLLALAPNDQVDPGVAVRWAVMPAATRKPVAGGATLSACGKGWCATLPPNCPCSGVAPSPQEVRSSIPAVQGFVLPKLKGTVWWVPSAERCPLCLAPSAPPR